MWNVICLAFHLRSTHPFRLGRETFLVAGFQPAGILIFGLGVPVLLEAGLFAFCAAVALALGFPAF
jgi:hypothetical protein